MTFEGYAYLRSLSFVSVFSRFALSMASVSSGAVLTAMPSSRFVLNPVFTTAPFSYVISPFAQMWQTSGQSAENNVKVGANKKNRISRST